MARKLCTVAAAALLGVLMLFGASSEAKVMEFDYFSIDVPEGWKVTEDKENSTIGFIAPDESAALTVAVIENEGMSIEEYAEGILNELKGNNLRELDDGYMFQFKTANGVDALGIVSGNDDLVMFMTAIGEHDDFDAMVNSMEER